tara:strand:+ start:312 stop:431 length:120 start_codon:yes stop_codon:yes gene_type:complete
MKNKMTNLEIAYRIFRQILRLPSGFLQLFKIQKGSKNEK